MLIELPVVSHQTILGSAKAGSFFMGYGTVKTAILVDGGFYRRMAQKVKGAISAEEQATELEHYCRRHLKNGNNQYDDLYRVFYYDCMPTGDNVYHPYFKKQIDYAKTDLYKWMNVFINELKKKRKFAIRLGRLAPKHDKVWFNVKPTTFKDLCNNKKQFANLIDDDFSLSIEQKGVDIKIGVDIASLAYKKQVDRIVLISGDSDFVPAAKLARREDIDFILDPLYNHIPADLSEHIDGLRTCDSDYKPTQVQHTNNN